MTIYHIIFDFYNVLYVTNQTGSEYQLNKPLIQFLRKLPSKCNLSVFTHSKSLVQSTEVQKILKPLFSNFFISSDMNLYKNQPESYLKLAKMLDAQPQEILFTDDMESNVQAAKEAGLSTIHFQSTNQCLQQLEKLLDLPDRI